MYRFKYKPFRFWCQKVLPLVYDDSLSYYELLCKVVHYINGLMEDLKEFGERIDEISLSFDELLKTYEELKEYVDTYFDELDLQDAINKRLDEMAESGELQRLVFNNYVIKDEGILSNFRFGYHPPENFDIDTFLSTAQTVLDTIKNYEWGYESTQASTTPLFTLNPYVITNNAGAVISCSTYVDQCLYLSGYTDLAGPSLFMTQKGDRFLGSYLESKGWTKFENQDEMTAGDIIAESWRRDSNDLYSPSHTYIYAGDNKNFEVADANSIKAGVKTNTSFARGLDQFYRIFENGIYQVKGDYKLQYSNDSSKLIDWKVLVMDSDIFVPNIQRNGHHTLQLFLSADRVYIRETSDNGINWSQKYRQFEQANPWTATRTANIENVDDELFLPLPQIVNDNSYFTLQNNFTEVLVLKNCFASIDLNIRFATGFDIANEAYLDVSLLRNNNEIGSWCSQTLIRNHCYIHRTMFLGAGDVLKVRVFTENHPVNISGGFYHTNLQISLL